MTASSFLSSQRGCIHQLVHTLSYGDAISTEVLALQRVLHACGIGSDIFALNTHPYYREKTKSLNDVVRDSESRYLFHYSLGSPLNDFFRSLASHQRILVYHNITPASYFDGVNPRVARDIREGLSDLPEMVKLSSLCIADSQFNANEIAHYDTPVELLPLLIDDRRWSVTPNVGMMQLLAGDPSFHLLHVGRIAPNKKIEDIIKVFYFFHHHVEKKSVLWLVGIDTDTELYSFSLRQLIRDFRLEEAVRFTGGISDEEVAALYREADCFLTMSAHEGFCVPLIEAMHFELPILAYAAGAIPETLGDAGVLFYEKRPAEIAELLGIIRDNDTFRRSLIEKGKARKGAFTSEAFGARVRGLLLDSPAMTPSRGSHR
jgi:L-malate glycosyltransferase